MSIEVKVTEPTESVEDSEKKDSEPNEVKFPVMTGPHTHDRVRVRYGVLNNACM